MKKTLSIAAVALLMAGSTAFACGCDKKKDKDASDKTAYTTEKSADQTSAQYACKGKKKDKGECEKTV